jgi:hypothetical protein
MALVYKAKDDYEQTMHFLREAARIQKELRIEINEPFLEEKFENKDGEK